MNELFMLATHNEGKSFELQKYLKDFSIITLPEDFPDIEETGTTLEENSIIKSTVVSDYYNVPAIADDSGLEVDYLNGAPGIYAHRYSNDLPFINDKETVDERNVRKLLLEMKDCPFEERTARFKCCISLKYPDKEPYLFYGVWEGKILFKPVHGKNGFAYDVVFYDNHYKKPASLLTIEEKGIVSHRSKAINNLISFINENC